MSKWRLKARLSFLYGTQREAEAIVEAVSPDNAKTPMGLRVETLREDRHLIALVQCNKGLNTFLVTLDDLIACISVAEKAFHALKGEPVSEG